MFIPSSIEESRITITIHVLSLSGVFSQSHDALHAPSCEFLTTQLLTHLLRVCRVYPRTKARPASGQRLEPSSTGEPCTNRSFHPARRRSRFERAVTDASPVAFGAGGTLAPGAVVCLARAIGIFSLTPVGSTVVGLDACAAPPPRKKDTPRVGTDPHLLDCAEIEPSARTARRSSAGSAARLPTRKCSTSAWPSEAARCSAVRAS